MLINLFFSYLANPHNQVGIYIASDPLTPEDYYFEVEILDSGNFATIGEMTLLQSFRYMCIHFYNFLPNEVTMVNLLLHF